MKFQNKEVEEIDTKVDSKSALRIRKAIKKNSIDTAWLLDVLINFDQLTLQPRSFTHKNKLRENKCAAIFALHNSWNILRFEKTSGGGKGRKRKVINLWKKNI